MWTYVIIGIAIIFVLFLCFALAVASFSFENYYEKLKQIDKIQNRQGISTLNYVKRINEIYFRARLQIAECPEFEDHYSTGKVSLSKKTMYSNSLASLSIVSHELGHARQDAEKNILKKHWKRRKVGKISGYFFLPLLVVGLVLAALYVFAVLTDITFLIAGLTLIGLSLFIFVFAIVLKYNEIKIEKEASDFAIEFLKEVLSEQEIKLCKEFLNSARLTYWASLLKTLLSWTMLTKKDVMFR